MPLVEVPSHRAGPLTQRVSGSTSFSGGRFRVGQGHWIVELAQGGSKSRALVCLRAFPMRALTHPASSFPLRTAVARESIHKLRNTHVTPSAQTIGATPIAHQRRK